MKKIKDMFVTAAQYGEIITALTKAKRQDLVVALADEMNTVTVNKESTKILDEKADQIAETLHSQVEKLAEGDVEADLLLKHLIKKLNNKFGEQSEEVSEDTEEAPKEDVAVEDESDTSESPDENTED